MPPHTPNTENVNRVRGKDSWVSWPALLVQNPTILTLSNYFDWELSNHTNNQLPSRKFSASVS